MVHSRPCYQKLAAKEYNRIAGHKAAGHEDGDGGSDDEEEKKKTPTLYKLLKTRLQKLVDKKDAQYVPRRIVSLRWGCYLIPRRGRVLSVEFMVLPNRKTWPMYYTIIKKPQCLDAISVCIWSPHRYVARPLTTRTEEVETEGVLSTSGFRERRGACVLECLRVQPGAYTDMGGCGDSTSASAYSDI